MELEFSNSGEPLTEQELEDFERKHGMKLPEQYRNFLMQHNGGEPNRPLVKLKGKRIFSEVVRYFLSISDDPHRSVYRFLQRYKIDNSRMPENLIPIATDPGGNLFVLSTDGKDRGSVYFWDHEEEADFQFAREAPTTRNLSLIARTFDEFLGGLKEEEQ